MSKKKIGLVPKLIMGIIFGILIGSFAPEPVVSILVTLGSLFSSFLKFVIPFIIVGFVTAGIADIATGAGKLLGITTALSYGSTIIAGTLSLVVSSLVFPYFINSNSSQVITSQTNAISPLFEIPLSPMMDVTSAIVFAFIMGIGISALRNNDTGKTLYNVFQEFQQIIIKVLATTVIPLLPIYIASTFANMTYTGQVWSILSVFWKVYLLVIPLQIIYVMMQFTVASIFTKRNPFKMAKKQIPAYLTALGTQSSAATIPVNLDCAKSNGISKEIREFTVPLCATIHLSGSIIALTSFSVAVLMMNGMDYSFSTMIPFILMLGIAMVAAPGAPGGAIMSALPFLPMIGIPSDGGLASLMIALDLTQDSFATASNVSGDNAIALIVDYLNKKWIKKEEKKAA